MQSTANPNCRVGLRFAVSHVLANAGFTFTLPLLGPSSGHVEYSADLIHWTSWTSFDTTNGLVQLHDLSATNAPMRFYRAVVP